MIVLVALNAASGGRRLVIGFDAHDAHLFAGSQGVTIGWDELAAEGPFEAVTFVQRDTDADVVAWVDGREGPR